jgi:hypothetical protein
MEKLPSLFHGNSITDHGKQDNVGTKHRLRHSCARLGKIALIKRQRYAHARQFNSAGKALRTLGTYLGRVIATSSGRRKTSPNWRWRSPMN